MNTEPRARTGAGRDEANGGRHGVGRVRRFTERMYGHGASRGELWGDFYICRGKEKKGCLFG